MHPHSQPDPEPAHPLPPKPSRVTPVVFLSVASLAPWQHTAAVLALFTAWAVIGSSRAASLAATRAAFRYTSSIMMGWMTLGCIVAGVYHRRLFFRDTLERNAQGWPLEAARGAAIYIAVVVSLGFLHPLLRHMLHMPKTDHSIVAALAPNTIAELAMWCIVSITAGFCEEHVFRGYLLPQCIVAARRVGLAPTPAALVAIFATSALFGALHLYQGVGGAIAITMLGAIFACIALHRGNLRAVIVAHFLQDFVAGFTLYLHHAHRP